MARGHHRTLMFKKSANTPPPHTLCSAPKLTKIRVLAYKVASGVKSLGVQEVFTVNGGIESFKDAVRGPKFIAHVPIGVVNNADLAFY